MAGPKKKTKSKNQPVIGNGRKIRVRLRGYDVELVDQAAKSIVTALNKTGAKYSGPIPLPTKINRFTVLRAVNVNIKSRQQYEMRIHKRLIDIAPEDGTIEALKKLELTAGVDVDIKQS